LVRRRREQAGELSDRGKRGLEPVDHEAPDPPFGEHGREGLACLFQELDAAIGHSRCVDHLQAEAAARELGRLDLEDALRLVLLFHRAGDRRFEPAAVRYP
jgi:hypothetical protein